MYNNRNKKVVGFMSVALLATSVALGQSAAVQHADAKDHGAAFRSLEHFAIDFRTDGTVPDSEVQGVYAQFDPVVDTDNPATSRTSFPVSCYVGNGTTPLIVRDGKFVCGDLVIPGTVLSGKYALTNITLIQAKLNRGHSFNIQAIQIEVINTQEHEIKLFDENQPKDVTVEKR